MTVFEPYWEHFDHEADIGVRGVGGSLASAFEQAALATSAVVTPLESIAGTTPVSLKCNAADPEVLFVDWLNAIVYEMATRNMLFSHYQVAINGSDLAATAWGEQVDVKRHQPAVEIKGATYTALHVYQDGAGHWVAETVVDV